MTRRKGELTTKQKMREWPFQVELISPEQGFGQQLNAMHAWAKEHTPAHVTISVNRYPIEGMRWCFKAEGDAVAFHLQFGGTLVAPEQG